MNVGEKYIIEIAEITTGAESGNKRARIKGFDGLCFDRNGINKLTKYDPEATYDKGYEARKAEESKSAEMLVTGDKEMLEREYQRGLDEAWETAFKVAFQDEVARTVIFGTKFLSNIRIMGAAKVIEILREREEKEKKCNTCKYYGTFSLECARCNDDSSEWMPKQADEIKVGDEVYSENLDLKFVVTRIIEGRYEGMCSDGACYCPLPDDIKKTDRHFEGVDSLLQQMRD